MRKKDKLIELVHEQDKKITEVRRERADFVLF